MSRPIPFSGSSCRREIRPVKRRTRTFRPNYLSFSGTYQCNLTCPHCSVPIEWPDRLSIEVGVRFLEEAHAEGIEIVSFTGGEPFLYPEFVVCVTKRAAELGMRFDKVQTNGVWYRDEAHLEEELARLRDAGFTGKLGLSVDKFHGRDIHKAATFCRTARRVFARDNIVSLSYASPAADEGLAFVRELAVLLDGVIDWSDWLHRYLLVSQELTIVLNWNHLAPVERAERLPGGWDGEWFEEDYCEGPGQALIVTPRGEVKPCCGFASDLDELTIGNVHEHSVKEIIERGREHPYVGKVFREGLLAIRDEVLRHDPEALPGATTNHCFFCWYVLSKNLTALHPETSPLWRMSLPLADASGLWMAFDGKTVHLWRELPAVAPQRGRVYRLSSAGTAVGEPPAERLSWAEYQAWIDGLRERGCTLTTREVAPCRG